VQRFAGPTHIDIDLVRRSALLRASIGFIESILAIRGSVAAKLPLYSVAYIDIASTHAQHREAFMKLSARNILKGKIVEVKKGQTTAHVRIDVGGVVVTASITNESVDDLKLVAGQAAYAVVKSSDVMIAID
jgi:molybdopterin-binding protein